MSTLADPAARERCAGRVLRLAPHAPRQWGRMTAHQMVCHLNDSFMVGRGEKSASRAPSFIPRSFVKWIALHTSLRWPRNVRTRPEIDQTAAGTPPADWSSDRDRLCAQIRAFPDTPQFAPHPIFGEMTRAEWLIWGYRHVDHHLRQFGC
jgi:Protein of unknown function (DUF1569)